MMNLGSTFSSESFRFQFRKVLGQWPGMRWHVQLWQLHAAMVDSVHIVLVVCISCLYKFRMQDL